jgi:hypothetical protein
MNISNASWNGKMNQIAREKEKRNMDTGLLALLRTEETIYTNTLPFPLSKPFSILYLGSFSSLSLSPTPSSTLLQLLN